MLYVMLMSVVVSALTSVGVIFIGRALDKRPIDVHLKSVHAQDPSHWMDNILAKSHPRKKPEPKE